MPEAHEEPRGLIASARRALRVLEVVADSGDGVTAKVIARRTALNLSTTYQLLNTLVHEGYLVRLQHAHGYGLGYKVFDLQRHASSGLHSLSTVANVLRDLHASAAAPLYFTTFRDTSLVVADVADSPEYPRAVPVDVGFHEQPHATAYGKIMLASLEDDVRDAHLRASGMSRLTRRTLTGRDELDEQLEVARRAGIGFESEEFQPGLTCLAVAVHDAGGKVRGAVAASSPTQQFLARRWEIEGVVRLAATRVSRVLVAADREARESVDGQTARAR